MTVRWRHLISIVVGNLLRLRVDKTRQVKVTFVDAFTRFDTNAVDDLEVEPPLLARIADAMP